MLIAEQVIALTATLTGTEGVGFYVCDGGGARGVRQVQISGFEAFMFNYFGKDSPVIPGGVFITTCILASGLFSLQQKNRANQQYAMRARVIGQVGRSCSATAHARREGG